MSLENMAELACVWEAQARKLGNVHPGVSFEDCNYEDFVLSASALKTAMRDSFTVGDMVFETIKHTREVVKSNTNLGIALLLAPLTMAARLGRAEEHIQTVLNELTIEDAIKVYQAIRFAVPGGLGQTPEQDINNTPTVTLLEAMTLAADRDLIARQYATGFRDVFQFGVPTLAKAHRIFGRVEPAIQTLQLEWLADTPDTLIARKVGIARAIDVQQKAKAIVALGGLKTDSGTEAWKQFDFFLRSESNRLNPGAIADLIAATLFVALANHTLSANDTF